MNKVFNEFGTIRHDNGVGGMTNKAIKNFCEELSKLAFAYELNGVEIRCLADYVNSSMSAHFAEATLRKGIAMREAQRKAARVDTVPQPTKRDLRTPTQWCDFFGVFVIDPDGWRDRELSFYEPITCDMFLDMFRRSTVKIVDQQKYYQWKHVF